MKRMFVGFTIAVLTIGLASADQFWAQATFVRGDVAVESDGSDSSTLSLGAVLHRGDRVKAAARSSASFLLNDGSILVVKPGTEAVLGARKGDDKPTLAAVAQNLSKTLLAREGNNPMLKHLGGLRGQGRNVAVAPSRTKVRPGDIDLMWVDHPGTSKYIVTLMGPGDDFIEETVDRTEFHVPADKLIPGETYFWEVRDARNPDSMIALGSATFQTLKPEVAESVTAVEKRLGEAFQEGSEQDRFTQHFLSYQILRENELRLDALYRVQEMIRLQPGDESLVRWQSDLVQEMGLAESDLARLSGP